MNPEKPAESSPHEAAPGSGRPEAEADAALRRFDDGIERIEADVQKIESMEEELRRKSLM